MLPSAVKEQKMREAKSATATAAVAADSFALICCHLHCAIFLPPLPPSLHFPTSSLSSKLSLPFPLILSIELIPTSSSSHAC